jgi:hypothetical protein
VSDGGARGEGRGASTLPDSPAYTSAGVNIAAGERAVDLIKASVRSTWAPVHGAKGPRVLGDLGTFSGLMTLGSRYRDPVLVSSTDGVGTKLKVAIALDRHDTIGRDLVAACLNDILTSGAEPLFFLDYVAVGKLVPERVAAIVDGIAAACKANGCALVGGETAEMPDVYAPDDYDLAGFIVGVVERDKIVDGSALRAGDDVWDSRRPGSTQTATAWRARRSRPWIGAPSGPTSAAQSATPCSTPTARIWPRCGRCWRPGWCAAWPTSPVVASWGTSPGSCRLGWTWNCTGAPGPRRRSSS